MMAFTKNPQQSTYQTKTIKLMKEVNTRNSDATANDEDFVNVYFEVIKNKLTKEEDQYIVKRAGASTFGSALASSTIRGVYYWEDQQRLYVCAGANLYYFNIATEALGATYTTFFSTSSGDVGFTEFLYDDNTVKLVVVDGTDIKTIAADGTIATSSDVDRPTPHIPQPIFLDGYLFLVKSSTADVYNSDLNDPLVYTAGNFFTAEMTPDQVVAMGKLNNYLAVFGTNSIEYFWDAAETGGSPMRRNDTPVKNVGYLGGLINFANKLYFIGSENEASPGVYVLEDFKIEKLSNEAVDRYLASLTTTYSTYKISFPCFNGHTFLVLSAGTRTYVYDLDTKLWVRWDWQSGGTGFNAIYAANTKSTSTYKSIIVLSGSAQLYKLLPTVYRDNSTNFTCTVVTPPNEFDTMNNKFGHRLVVWADKPRTSSMMSVSWTDDDYETYTTAVTLDLNDKLPAIYQLSDFRRRAFKFTYTDNYPMRLYQVEIYLNMGNT